MDRNRLYCDRTNVCAKEVERRYIIVINNHNQSHLSSIKNKVGETNAEASQLQFLQCGIQH